LLGASHNLRLILSATLRQRVANGSGRRLVLPCLAEGKRHDLLYSVVAQGLAFR
jgi:hypothetical protein